MLLFFVLKIYLSMSSSGESNMDSNQGPRAMLRSKVETKEDKKNEKEPYWSNPMWWIEDEPDDWFERIYISQIERKKKLSCTSLYGHQK
mmetsp:Transcript_1240/g.1738  ORF Transcript_1240/g.1738 Transcript_1240/m.1738 type:complete len:89 (-) Transcript_1240:53-319(-)